MKTFKRFAAAIMIGIMAVSFTACNDDKNDSKSTMTTETVTAESVFDKALENIKNTSSYTATTKVDGTLTGGGVDSNVLVESNIDFIADRFLYNMIRSIVGTLLLIERNSLAPETLKEILDSRDKTKAGSTISPIGLTLVEVIYNNIDGESK